MDVFWSILVLSVAIIIIVLIAIRKSLVDKKNALESDIASLTAYIEKSKDDSKTQVSVNASSQFENLHSQLEANFAGRFITGFEEDGFKKFYSDINEEVCSLLEKLERFHIEPSDRILNFAEDYRSIHRYVLKHNEETVKTKLNENADFFDYCLSYPLDSQQRLSIVMEEDNSLVVSSAGSGKTSSIVGKVKYLIEKEHIKPERILLISYTNKAATELTERMNIPGLRGYTFHKLALDILGKYTGVKPSVCDNTDSLFVQVFHTLLKNRDFQKSVIEYFIDFPLQEEEWAKSQTERKAQLAEAKVTRIQAMFPDMDGNTIYVKSEQEKQICFVLSSLGVKFRYEEPYEHPLADEIHSQYKPDFSIYYEKNGKMLRVYLEHFGIDEHGFVPMWFAEDNNMTYEEANEKYGNSTAWKEAAHKKFGTTMVSTSSADFHYFDIKEKLKSILDNIGIPIEEKTEEELYEMVLPKSSKREQAFIRLVSTFITLMKSSCRSMEELLEQVKHAKDERSYFIIKNIFKPVYEKYVEELKWAGQIDFIDVILRATKLCNTSHPVSFDHIIVDEFQDISMDRYMFLKALRNSTPPAKLYCVGDDWQSIYRFSGSDMALFNQFPDFFGHTVINKIETTYRFGEPLVGLSSKFVQKNTIQIKKNIHPFNLSSRTELKFLEYDRPKYCERISELVSLIPKDKSLFLLGRYSFDDYYLSFKYKSIKEGDKFFYVINGRKIEFLTVHKSKGLEADYVIILLCNKGTYGFPSAINDDPVLNYVLTKGDKFPYGEERRLFYVAITRAKVQTMILYDKHYPSVFVDEFLHPEKVTMESYQRHPNANKRWTRKADRFLVTLYTEGKSVRYISEKMGRSQTSVVMRLGKLGY